MNEESLKVNDRLSVFLRTWAPRGSLRGVIGLVNGLGEHSGQYEHVAEFLADRGFLVLAPDLPGHGKNPGVRGHATHPPFGEVVGALVEETRRRAGVVASSPSLGGPDPQPPAVKKALAKVLSGLAPSVTMENGLDSAAIEAIRRDPLFNTKVSALLAVGFLSSWEWFARWPGGTLVAPVLLLQGTADRCVDPKATVAVAGRLEGDATLKSRDGFGHVLRCAPEKAEVLTYIAGWMDERVA